jgi:GTPase SAR1 family protein
MVGDNYKILKIAICGAERVGKTSLARLISQQGLETEYSSTIGVDFIVRHLPKKKFKNSVMGFRGITSF